MGTTLFMFLFITITHLCGLQLLLIYVVDSTFAIRNNILIEINYYKFLFIKKHFF